MTHPQFGNFIIACFQTEKIAEILFVVWGVKIGQVYCKFFHKLTKKPKKSPIDFSLHATTRTNKSLD